MSQSPSTLSLHYMSEESNDELVLEALDCEDEAQSKRKTKDTIQVLKEFLKSKEIFADLKACKALYDMMPEAGTEESWYEGNLSNIIMATAKQIPHNSAAQNKLVRLMGELARCDRFNVLLTRRWYTHPERVGQLSLAYSNYLRLCVYGRAWWELFNAVEPQQYDSEFVDLCAFQARLSAAGVMDNTSEMLWTMREVLEQPIDACTSENFSIQIKLVAVWILHGGQLFYKNIVIDPEPATGGSRISYRAYELYSGPVLGLQRWNFWQARLSELANHSDISEEGRDLGTRAADIMATLARAAKRDT